MGVFAKPKIVISKCIEFESCRWNGLTISSDAVKLLKPFAEFIPVCPEMEVGLGVPRAPVRIVSVKGDLKLMQAETDMDLTDKMREFVASFLDSITYVDAFILKERSPSCGTKTVKVYPGMGKAGPLHAHGAGFFGRAVMDRFPDNPIEDEGRLRNYDIREHFLTRIFALAAFREVRGARAMGRLVDFHTRNKLLLMAYSQKELKNLGNVVANRKRLRIGAVLDEYERGLRAALSAPPPPGPCANVLMHALGYFSRGLSAREKEFFLDSLRKYRARRVPLSVPIAVMRSWIGRFDETYLAAQAFFSPFPEELVVVSDSGKGRELWR
jgi:uncharacterized protein YbgA (DUF1722 family)/uncharacterized protein YbbK (DUF523 family)